LPPRVKRNQPTKITGPRKIHMSYRRLPRAILVGSPRAVAFWPSAPVAKI